MKTKLLNKTLRYYILFAAIALLAVAPVFYYTTQWLYIRKSGKTLKLSKKEFFEYSLPHLKVADISLWNQTEWNVKIEPYRKGILHDTIFNQMVLDSIEKAYDPYRILLTPVRIENQPFTLMVRLNVIESDDILRSTVQVFLIIITLILAGLFFITKWLSVRLWNPFYTSISQIEQFEINKNYHPSWIQTDIKEFCRLNEALDKLIQRNRTIYSSQNEFLENAAHELQTPLAVFQGKLDELMQTDRLSKQQADIIEYLNASISRLNRLNKNLLLLSKLDHPPFPDEEILTLKETLCKQVEFFTAQAQEKKIHFEYIPGYEVILQANSDLMDILLGNLLFNALKYTKEEGSILLSLVKDKIIIRNTGQGIPLDENQLFRRFSKTKTSSGGFGLGLSIAKKIAELYGWNLSYEFEDNMHTFSINF